MVDAERIDWIERWANGWLRDLARESSDHYYANLPLDVACGMIVELAVALRDLAREIKADIDLFDKGGAMKKLRSYDRLAQVLLEPRGYVVYGEDARLIQGVPHAVVYNDGRTCWCGEQHEDET